jgi:methylenetetrahydrofolate dehydrogenase (NADP+)/methenyltetrahydrofolate cyclohydrolase
MEEKLIKGNEIKKLVHEEVRAEAEKLKKLGITPGLVVVLVGDDPASAIYVRNKGKACEAVGIYSETIHMAADTSQEKLTGFINELNQDSKFHGILVQLPLPGQINEKEILEMVNPAKDVDCFHPENVGRLVAGDPYVLPCTPAGIVELLKASSVDPAGKHAVVIGRSNIVGKPMVNLLMQKSANANATVTVVHSRTKDIADHLRRADILIAAMGKAHFVTADMVKQGAVVIDVGMNRIPWDNEKGSKLVGDVDFDAVLPLVSKITPVPGGVGPMTIAMLLKNTITATKRQNNID